VIHDPRFRWCVVLVLMAGLAAWMFLSGADGEPVADTTARKTAPKQPELTAEQMRLAAIRGEAGAQIGKILQAENAQDRARAIALLKNLGPEALAVARELFHEMEDGRRDAGAFVLATLGNEDDKRDVAHAFIDDNGNPPALLALAAASLRDPFLVDRFLDQRDNPDPQVREAVCYALRASPTPDMADILGLLADGEPRVRAAAERSVTEMLPKANPASLKGVVDHALRKGDPAARVGALRLAGRVNGEWVIQMAGRSTTDANSTVRRAAVKVLVKSGDPSAAPVLAAMVQSGNDRGEKVRAANALGKIPADAATLDKLASAARGKDPVVALAAARSLVERRDVRGVPELIRLQSVRQSAELNVDDEDEQLLRGLTDDVLRQASKGTRRSGESYAKWWKRVEKRYKVPASPFLPQFPSNH